MAPKRRVIIDTDPGVDDVLAMLLALAATPEELEVVLISVTHGNVDVESCLRNVVSVFHHIHKEQEWRKSKGRPEGFDTLKSFKPVVAVGADAPLDDQLMMADYFHGFDGLGGIHKTHPHLTPAETWRDLFKNVAQSGSQEEQEAAREIQGPNNLFIPSQSPAHEEILRVLRDNDRDSITIVAIGPLTNIAKAAAADPETFLRVKEVIVMGGAVDEQGNVQPPLQPPRKFKEPPFRLIKQPPGPVRNQLNERNQMTPVAEFNTYADAMAAARVYALTSPKPSSTMPPVPPAPPGKVSDDPPPPFLAPYPEKLSRQLTVTLFPLDITTPHELKRGLYRKKVTPAIEAGSPLAEWVTAFLSSTFDKMESLMVGMEGDNVGLALHDPLCIWYCLTGEDPKWEFIENEDLRVETSGQWTRGMCVVDRRSRKKRELKEDDTDAGEVPGDTGNWLNPNAGNRLRRPVKTPGNDLFGGYLLDRVFS